jgi:hypothetical protein
MRTKLLLFLVLVLMALPSSVMACAACFGQSDSDMAKGLNAGIFLLFGIVACVLGGFVALFIYMARRSARVHALADALAVEDDEGGESVSSSQLQTTP